MNWKPPHENFGRWIRPRLALEHRFLNTALVPETRASLPNSPSPLLTAHPHQPL